MVSPTGIPSTIDEDVIDNQHLTLEECWAQLASAGLGRLATATSEGVDIFPVNYLVHDSAIFFRSAPGSKMANVTASPRVAFEADGFDGRWHWSVVVHGEARRLGTEAEIVESGIASLASWSAMSKYNYVRITPDEVTGRRIDRFQFERTAVV